MGKEEKSDLSCLREASEVVPGKLCVNSTHVSHTQPAVNEKFQICDPMIPGNTQHRSKCFQVSDVSLQT